MLEIMKTFGRHNKHQKVVRELIHLADPQICVCSGKSGKHTEKKETNRFCQKHLQTRNMQTAALFIN